MTIKEASDRSRGHIKNLEPSFGDRVSRWYSELISKKIPVLIYCSSRTPKEQEELYAQGRTKGGTKVTNARGIPPQSLHIDQGKGSHAIDYVPLSLSSTGSFIAAWDDSETYAICQKIAEKHQLRFLEWEQPHLEDALISGWRELVTPQKEQLIQKKSIVKKFPWSSR
jgi:hypothetical protein